MISSKALAYGSDKLASALRDLSQMYRYAIAMHARRKEHPRKAAKPIGLGWMLGSTAPEAR